MIRIVLLCVVLMLPSFGGSSEWVDSFIPLPNETKKVSPWMSFYNKYPDLQSWMDIKCDNGQSVVYFGFNETPIIHQREILNYYSFSRAEITANGKTHPVSLFRKEGSNFVITPDGKHFLDEMDSHVILKIDLFGTGDYYFEYDTSTLEAISCKDI